MAVTFTQLLVHVVFGTKHRAASIRPEIREELYSFMAAVVLRHGGQLVAIGGMPDHVHLLLRLKPYVPVSAMVRFVKSNSARWLQERSGSASGEFWQNGYGAFSVSESRSQAVEIYIHNQESHHSGKSFESEVEILLRRHNVCPRPS